MSCPSNKWGTQIGGVIILLPPHAVKALIPGHLMSLFKEKREGLERRTGGERSGKTSVERRASERRQIALMEISFMEWATQFARYKKRAGSGVK